MIVTFSYIDTVTCLSRRGPQSTSFIRADAPKLNAVLHLKYLRRLYIYIYVHLKTNISTVDLHLTYLLIVANYIDMHLNILITDLHLIL